jgi:DNA-binding transcriptional ArsR family regulator
MRKPSSLDALFPRIRQAVLAATVMHPDHEWYLSDLAHHLKVRPSSLQRELAALVEAGILQRRRDGNRVYYQADPACPFLTDLQGLLTKTVGLVDILQHALLPFSPSFDCAFIYGSLARHEEVSTSDVDLMIIGDLRLATAAGALREAERQILRPINPTLFTREEFATRLAAGNHFLNTVMRAPKLFLKGNENELAEVIVRAQDPAAYDEPAGDERLEVGRRA